MKIIRADLLTGKTFWSIARLHRTGITTGFLSTLGDGFLATLYRGIAADRDSVVFVAVSEDGVPVGFCAGTLDTGKMYRRVLLRRGWVLGIKVLPSLLIPSRVRRMVETVAYALRKKPQDTPVIDSTIQRFNSLSNDGIKGSQPESLTPVTTPVISSSIQRFNAFSFPSELLSIALDSSHRGKGIGRQLVSALDDFFRSRGVKGYKVVTLAEDPISNGFYRGCGLAEAGEFLHHGNRMAEYVKEFETPCRPG
jgi:GNAT superfamily N-acetyltransferase